MSSVKELEEKSKRIDERNRNVKTTRKNRRV